MDPADAKAALKLPPRRPFFSLVARQFKRLYLYLAGCLFGAPRRQGGSSQPASRLARQRGGRTSQRSVARPNSSGAMINGAKPSKSRSQFHWGASSKLGPAASQAWPESRPLGRQSLAATEVAALCQLEPKRRA